jgi:hypothetical protein
VPETCARENTAESSEDVFINAALCDKFETWIHTETYITVFPVIKPSWNLSFPCMHTSPGGTFSRSVMWMLAVKSRNANCLWWWPATAWFWRIWVYIFCSVNQTTYKSFTKQFMAEFTPTWAKNYIGVEDCDGRLGGKTVFFCQFPGLPGNTVVVDNNIAHVNRSHVAVLSMHNGFDAFPSSSA